VAISGEIIIQGAAGDLEMSIFLVALSTWLYIDVNLRLISLFRQSMIE
jgi:hypothetical protein